MHLLLLLTYDTEISYIYSKYIIDRYPLRALYIHNMMVKRGKNGKCYFLLGFFET